MLKVMRFDAKSKNTLAGVFTIRVDIGGVSLDIHNLQYHVYRRSPDKRWVTFPPQSYISSGGLRHSSCIGFSSDEGKARFREECLRQLDRFLSQNGAGSSPTAIPSLNTSPKGARR